MSSARHGIVTACLMVLATSGPGEVVASGARGAAAVWDPLPPAKQQRIREYVRSRGIAARAPGRGVQVGARMPLDVPLRGLPRDMVTEIPKVTSYRYVVLRDGIAIVEPSTRKVVDVISR